MSYQDKATPEELQYLALYNQHKDEIEALARREHGWKDPLEHAFKVVTGVDWPAGRGLKLTNGQAEITGDRTFKSILGRYVAPIGAAAATAFGVPGLFPGLLTGGGATGGAATGVAEQMAQAGGYGTAAAGGGTGAGSLLSTIAKKGGTSILSRIAQGAKDGGLDAAAAGINAATQDAANDRGQRLTHEDVVATNKTIAQDAFERALIAREEENRAAEKEARARVTQDEYNINRKPFVAPTIRSNVAGVKPQTVTDWGIGRTQGPTENEIAALTADRDRARDRLMAGPNLPPLPNLAQDPYYTQPSENLNPGGWERAGRIAGPTVSIWGKIAKYL